MDKSTLLQLQQLFFHNLDTIDKTIAERNQELVAAQERIRVLTIELHGLNGVRNYHTNVISQQISREIEETDKVTVTPQ